MTINVQPTYASIQCVRDLVEPWIELLGGDEWGESMSALYEACNTDYGFSDEDCALFATKLVENLDAMNYDVDVSYGSITIEDVTQVQQRCAEIRHYWLKDAPPETIASIPEWIFGESSSSGYDSRKDTWEHIGTVRRFLGQVIDDLAQRAMHHDSSKLEEPELLVFDEFTPKLKDSTYGSDEYKSFLEGMGEGLRHHYAVNDHHPEHFEHGIADMDLIQVLEMLADWKAATLRHANGDLDRSITQNAERFVYGPEIEGLLRNTAQRMGWLLKSTTEET